MVLFVFKRLSGARGNIPILQKRKVRLGEIIVQDPRSSEWLGLDSNQSQLAWSQSLLLSTTWCHRPYARAHLQMRNDASHSEEGNRWNLSFVFLDIAMTQRQSLGSLDLNVSNVQRILFPF